MQKGGGGAGRLSSQFVARVMRKVVVGLKKGFFQR